MGEKQREGKGWGDCNLTLLEGRIQCQKGGENSRATREHRTRKNGAQNDRGGQNSRATREDRAQKLKGAQNLEPQGKIEL